MPGSRQAPRYLSDDRAFLGRWNQQVASIRRAAAGFMTDQVAWIRDHSHVRKITEENGRTRSPSPAPPTGWPRS